MRIGFCAALVGSALALLLNGPATAKSVHPHAHPLHADRHYAQSHYDYRSASIVREEFIDAPRRMRPSHMYRSGGYAVEERRDSRVVENLRGDFTGGVGYGANGDAFVDGYGQTHFFVGSFRGMNPLPHGPYQPSPGRRF